MLKINRSTVASAATVIALLSGFGGMAIGASAVAAASGGNVEATGGDGTTVDRDGTQGSFGDSVQGAADSDGDQDAFLIQSEDAAPKVKAGK